MTGQLSWRQGEGKARTLPLTPRRGEIGATIMVDDPAELPFLSNVGLMLTFRCTTACPLCVVDAGPHRKETMPIERSLDWIDQIRAYRGGRVCGLALTGRDPLTEPDTLAKVTT